MKRPERVAAVGEGRRLFKAEDIRRAPQQGQIPENQGVGQIWDDKQKKVWYNSIIKKGKERKPVGLQWVFAFSFHF